MLYTVDQLQGMGISPAQLLLMVDGKLLHGIVGFDLTEGYVLQHLRPHGEKYVTKKVRGELRLFYIDPHSGIGHSWLPPAIH